MVTGQGLESMWLQHKECHDQLWAGLTELGLEPYGARCCCTHKAAVGTAAAAGNGRQDRMPPGFSIQRQLVSCA